MGAATTKSGLILPTTLWWLLYSLFITHCFGRDSSIRLSQCLDHTEIQWGGKHAFEPSADRWLGPEDCAAAKDAYRIFTRIRDVAGFSSEEISFQITTSVSEYAQYSFAQKTIFFPLDFFQKHPGESLARDWMIGHEMGHAIQQREGLSTLTNFGIDDHGRTLEQAESHADLIAVQLIATAGLPQATIRKGTEQLLSCGSIIHDIDASPGYPRRRDRWINALVSQEIFNKQAAAIQGAIRSDSWGASRTLFDGDQKGLTLDASPTIRGQFQMTASPDIFLADGRLKLRTNGVPIPSETMYGPPTRDESFKQAAREAWSEAIALVELPIVPFPEIVSDVAVRACGLESVTTLASAVKASRQPRHAGIVKLIGSELREIEAMLARLGNE